MPTGHNTTIEGEEPQWTKQHHARSLYEGYRLYRATESIMIHARDILGIEIEMREVDVYSSECLGYMAGEAETESATSATGRTTASVRRR